MVTTPPSVVTETPDRLRVDLPDAEQSVVLNARIPGINAAELTTALRWSPDDRSVHVACSAVPRRITLLYLYDTLTGLGLTLRPTRADAVAAWDELRQDASSDVGALVPIGPRESGASGARPIVLGDDGFDPLLVVGDESVFVNHVWVLCTALGFPRAQFETLHANLAAELSESVSKLPHPQCFVHAYRHRRQSLPLLLWYRINEEEVICMLQEFLHLRYRHIPGIGVWHWQILPSHANVNLVGLAFMRRGLYPSWTALQRYAGVGERSPISAATALAHAGRTDADGTAYTEYERGVLAFWIGDEVFFAVSCERPLSGGGRPTLRLPDTHRELPAWVVPLLQSAAPAKLEEFGVAAEIDRYLREFAALNAAPSVRLLRPLVWKPLFLKAVPYRTTAAESVEAQARLVKGATAVWDDPETVAEAIETLYDLTGARAQ